MNGLDNKPLLGIRQWLIYGDGYLHSLFYDAVWRPGEDMHAGSHLLEPITKKVPVEFRTINMHDHYLKVADERDRMGYPMSAMRNRLKAKTMEEQGAWHVAYEATRWEMTSHMPGFKHDAPADNCTCGLYANYLRSDYESWPHIYVPMSDRPDKFTGLVAAWGETLLHRRGFRAEYMRIVALLPPAWQRRKAVSNLAELYGVPVLKPEEIELFALAENYQIYTSEAEGGAENELT